MNFDPPTVDDIERIAGNIHDTINKLISEFPEYNDGLNTNDLYDLEQNLKSCVDNAKDAIISHIKDEMDLVHAKLDELLDKFPSS